MFLAAIAFIILVISIIVLPLGGDAVFPISGTTFPILENNYNFLWHQDMLGTVGVLDKIRGPLADLLSLFHVFNFELFTGAICIIGFVSFYFLLQTIFGIPKNRYHVLGYMLAALFYVFNPLTIQHFSHYFLVQGYYIYPLILSFYIRYIRSTEYFNIYLVFFPIFVLFLGQPHNYYNGFVIIFISFLFFGYQAFHEKKIINFFKKHLVLSGYVSVFLFPIIGSFVSSLPNDLTSSATSFSGSEPNMIWSMSQGIINTITFKIDFFVDHSILMIIFLSINSLILMSLFFSSQRLQYKKYFLVIFMVIMSLTFIAKNPFFSSFPIRQIVYKFVPHLRVDVAYIELIFIFIFILGIGYLFTLHKMRKWVYLLLIGLIIQILVSVIIGYSYFRKNENIIDQSSYSEFTTWINKTIKTHDSVLMQPLSVTYVVPGVSRSIYPVLFIEKNPILHWLFLEGTLQDTLKLVNGNKNLLNSEFLEKTNIRYIFCFPEGCAGIDNNKNFRLLGAYQMYSIYEYVGYNGKFITEDIQYSTLNPTQYHITTTLKSKQDLKFLQSYHPQWKLYLEPYTPLDCGSGATVYSGTTLESRTRAKPLLVSPYQGGDGTTYTTSTGIYLSQRGDTLASIARSQTGMTLTGIIALNPGVTREVLRRGTEIVVSTSEQNPPNPLSQGGTGTIGQTGTGESYHVTECPSTNTFYAGGELAKLWQEPIFDDTHQMVYDYANQWTIDPEYIRANYPKDYYKENPDGTIDVRMTMYFRPQSYFYLGLIISGFTLLGCVSYLVVSGLRGRQRR